MGNINQKLISFKYEGDGLQRGYENDEWTVGIKNYKKTNDINYINNLEKHNNTDELFVLSRGNCSIVTANENNGSLEYEIEKMKNNTIYIIPKGLWHNTIIDKDTKLILVENADTSMDNSDILNLKIGEIEKLKNKFKLLDKN